MTIEEIKAYIAADGRELQRRQKLYRYYRMEHDILSAEKKDDGKPDNRLAHGFANYICNAYAGYMFGQPVTYAPVSAVATGDSEAGLAMLLGNAESGEELLDVMRETYAYNDEEAENAALGLDCAICGTAVEIMYVDADAVTRFARVDPVGCIAITDGTIEDRLTYNHWYAGHFHCEKTIDRLRILFHDFIEMQ